MKAPRKLDAAGLWEYASRVLAGRAHATGELGEKLRRRALSPEDVDATLARLKEYGYLDDRAFAESYAAARLENQRQGRMRVLRDLRERRVGSALAEGAVRKSIRTWTRSGSSKSTCAAVLRRAMKRSSPRPTAACCARGFLPAR